MIYHKDYYAAQMEELLESFKKSSQGYQMYLERVYDAATAKAIVRQAIAEYEALLPLLPNIGDSQTNLRVADFLPIAARYLAYYRPMKDWGASPEIVGKMFYDLYAYNLERVPNEQARIEGERQFTEEYISKFKEWAAWTQNKDYPANWVAVFVPGDGQTFDYGWDYTECAMVKYLRAYGAVELAPYMCPVDFVISRTYGTGLRRTGALAYGDKVCDFRFTKSGSVDQDWDSELRIIRERLQTGRVLDCR